MDMATSSKMAFADRQNSVILPSNSWQFNRFGHQELVSKTHNAPLKANSLTLAIVIKSVIMRVDSKSTTITSGG